MNKKILIILAIVTTVILGGIAVFTAVRLYQLKNEAVAPNVPSSQPAAAGCGSTCDSGCTGGTVCLPDGNGKPKRCKNPACADASICDPTGCRATVPVGQKDCRISNSTCQTGGTCNQTTGICDAIISSPTPTATTRSTTSPTPTSTSSSNRTNTPTPTASSRATVTPTATTRSKTPTPTAKVTQPVSDTGTPVAGVAWPTVLLLTIGSVLVTGSIFLVKKSFES